MSVVSTPVEGLDPTDLPAPGVVAPGGPTARPVAATARILELDGLRAVAVLAVVAFHAFPSVLPGGGAVGVLVFFVLSGYLITGVLLGERSRWGRVDLPRFWARRLTRLFPPMAVVVLVAPLLPGVADRGPVSTLRDAVVGLGYLTNLVMVAAPDLVPVVTRHLWSLATEEQFYLCWPLVLAALARPGPVVRPAVRAVAAALAAVAVGFASTSVDGPSHPAYYLPTMWAQALVIGGVGAHLVGTHPLPRTLARLLRRSWPATGCAALLPLATARALQGGMVPVLALATLVVVVHACSAPTSALASLLRSRPLVAVGQRSYSLYLVHPLALVASHAAWGGARWVLVPALLLSASAAWLLHALVERPTLRWKDRFAPAS